MENEVNSDLHIAAALNHATVMRDMLATNCQLVERMDEHGDQPAHIAARLGNIEALRVLVEFDAPMSTRNYNFLTPLGEARMNERHDVIRLLNDNYIFRPNDGISRYVFRRIYPSTIPCQTVARAAARKLRVTAMEKAKDDCSKGTVAGLHEFILHKNATAAQKWWRLMRAKDGAQKIRAATMFQTAFRMHLERSFYKAFYRERLIFYKRRIYLAKTYQRLWRGYLGRAVTRKLLERMTLPDPNDPRNHDRWLLIQEESHPPLQRHGVIAEYILSGAPKCWKDRRVKRNEKHFRDVKFWVNEITRKVYWEKPVEYFVKDNEVSNITKYQNAVVSVQRWWRIKMLKKCLRLLAKASRIMQAVDKYSNVLDDDDIALYNYTLYVHVILGQKERAGKLYSICMDRMQVKGVDNAFIMYSFAIFLVATREGETDLIEEIIQRGRNAEERWRDFRNITSSIYDVACWGFFRFQAITSQSAEGWYQFALCRLLVYNDFIGSRRALFEALQIEPKNRRVKEQLSLIFKKEDITVRFV